MNLKPTLMTAFNASVIITGAVLCGFLAWWIRFPLPWMIGAMVFTSSVRLLNFRVLVPVQTRKLGQILVASSVGLSFTPDALRQMGSLAIPMVLTAVLTIFASILVARVLTRMAHINPRSAILSILPIGPVESAVLAKQYSVSTGPVVFSQALRIVLIVVLIPPVIVYLDGTIADPVMILRGTEWTFLGSSLLFALGVAGALVMAKLRSPNPHFLGAIIAASIGALISLPVSPYPYLVLAGAQIFLGIWLGAAIDRELFKSAGNFIFALVLTSFMMIAFCIILGLTLAWATGQPWQVMILSTAPGSVTEMSLTAKILQEGLAVVTAFHITRILIIIPFSGVIVAQSLRFIQRK